MDEEDKSAKNASQGSAGNLIDQANRVMPPVIAGIGADKATSAGRAATTFDAAQSGYQNQQTTGGFNADQLANLRTTLAGMQPTGGYDQAQLANLRTSLTNMLPSGGYDQARLDQTLGGYGSMADTGGFSAADRQNFLNQATSGSTATASNLAAAAARNAAATGGNAGAALANIQRTAGQQ